MTDVRYRLSAEGVAEVVAAFRKVQTEALRSTTAAKNGFSGFGSALSGIKGLLVSISAAIGGISLARLVTEASNLGEQLQNLKLRFRAAVQDLSVFRVGAEKTGSNLADLAPQLTKLFADMKAASGDLSGEVADNFRAAGVSTREIANFAKQDFVGRLTTLANALQKIPEADRADAAIAALGVRGAKLIPILEEIGTEGFAGMREEAEKLAAVMTEDMVAATGAVNDSFDDLRLQTTGLAAQFVTGLAPALTAGLKAIQPELTSGAQGWKLFGNLVGNVLGFLAVTATNAFDSIHTRATTTAASIIGLGRAIAAAVVGNFEEAGVHLEAIGLRREREEKLLAERIARSWDLFRNPRATEPGATGPSGDEAEAAAAARAVAEASTKARIAARRAGIDSELALVKAGLKLQDDAAETAFRDNLTTLREYYDERRRIATEGINAEIRALQDQRIHAKADKDKGLAELQKIDGQIAKLALERQDRLAELNAKEVDDYRQLAAERLELDRTVAEARGDHDAIALANIEEQIRKADELLHKLGGDEAANAATLRDTRDALSTSVEFHRLSGESARALDDFARDRAAIERQAAAGLLSQAETEAQILALEEERIAALRALSDEMLEVAERTRNPESIARARDFAAGIDDISASIRSERDDFRRLASDGIDTARTALEQFLATGINNSPTFIGALRAIGAAVQQLAAKFIALRIVSGFLGLFGGSAAADDKAFSFASATGEFAEGGLIEGPGTGTSDSILARLSNREYVVKARAVAQPGNLALLEAINAGAMRSPVRGPLRTAYAEGGLVDLGVSGSAGKAGGQGSESTLRIGLDEGLILRALQTPEGQRVLVRTIAKNRRAISGTLR